MLEEKIELTEDAPLLLRRIEDVPGEFEVGGEILANMTVVTTKGNAPEMHDQKTDPTAPRND